MKIPAAMASSCVVVEPSSGLFVCNLNIIATSERRGVKSEKRGVRKLEPGWLASRFD